MDERTEGGILKIFLIGDKSVGVTSFFKKYCGRITNQSGFKNLGLELSFKVLKANKEKTLQNF